MLSITNFFCLSNYFTTVNCYVGPDMCIVAHLRHTTGVVDAMIAPGHAVIRLVSITESLCPKCSR